MQQSPYPDPLPSSFQAFFNDSNSKQSANATKNIKILIYLMTVIYLKIHANCAHWILAALKVQEIIYKFQANFRQNNADCAQHFIFMNHRAI